MVYVKEHPTQFMINNEGHTSRMADLYDDLVKNSRVRLISTSVDTFELIDHSKGIGTVCGTVGWESIVHRKPVVLFGVSWYENYTKGVLRIKSEENVRQIREFIENYEYDEHALKAYLAAVSKNTSVAYYFKTYGKDTLNMSEDDCINNITKAIIKKIEE
jgi:capsule polysaccharide export protein KpsC/LpsZ